jgi:hypothetical protein
MVAGAKGRAQAEAVRAAAARRRRKLHDRAPPGVGGSSAVAAQADVVSPRSAEPIRGGDWVRMLAPFNEGEQTDFRRGRDLSLELGDIVIVEGESRDPAGTMVPHWCQGTRWSPTLRMAHAPDESGYIHPGPTLSFPCSSEFCVRLEPSVRRGCEAISLADSPFTPHSEEPARLHPRRAASTRGPSGRGGGCCGSRPANS